MIKILCIHQGYELYGSDRMFLLSLKAFREKYGESKITVHLPKEGDLSEIILRDKLSDELVIRDMAILRKSEIKKFKFAKIFRQLFNILSKIKICNEYDIVYVNSIVVIDYLIACRFTNAKTIVHIHEIPTKAVTFFFQQLIRFSQSHAIFISKAVKKNFSRIRNGHLVINGIKGFKPCKGEQKEVMNILHIGRINAWKGQDILLRSIIGLDSLDKAKIRVHIVGGVFEDQSHYLKELKITVSKFHLDSIIKFYDFSNNPEEDYRWADVVVVPSKLPEPFGLVAVEAMSAGAVVIAAQHGGLSEVFEDGISGIYFKPNCERELKKAIISVLNNTEKMNFLSINGRELFLRKFTESAYISRFISALGNIEK